MPDRERYDAVILAGGSARRLGGADKPGALVRGRTLVSWVADAVADAERLILVGPARAELPQALVVREDPPGGGPIPALRAGLAEVQAPCVALLAADLPYLRASHIDLLREAAVAAGAVLVDADGREQWLAGFWRTGLLREALEAYEGSSLFGLLRPLEPVLVAAKGEPWFDCDTPADLARARG